MAANNCINSNATGLQSLTTGGTFNGRTLTGTANQVAVANGTGAAGNPTISLTSTIQVSGISFDSGSNTLSSYSTGTFTPTLTASTSNPTVGYSVQLGRYTRVGNRVFFTCNMQLSSVSGGSGNIRISNLPFTSQATTDNNPKSAHQLENTTYTAGVLYYNANISVGTTDIRVEGIRSATTVAALGITAVTATSKFLTTMVYEV